ncbi:MAG: hypothetical protein KC609_03905, partial [Myxococcales bacterium]|nr:hypothetical protein [Myxococcales bacterium]
MKSLSLVGWLPVLAVAFVLASCNDPRQPIMTKEQKAKVGKHLLASANPQHKLGARFDNKLELVGVDLSSQRLNVGQRLQITYYWKCLGKINGDWKIFVHWDMRGRIGDDHYPIGGLFRFNRCQPGKIVRDIRSMVASRRLGNGGVSRVYVGVYNPKILDPSGRMRLTNPRPGWTLNRVIAATITVGRGVTRP